MKKKLCNNKSSNNKSIKKKIIVITGTPGTGKAALAGFLAKKLGFGRLNLHKHYKKISTGYNRKKRCYDIELRKFEMLVKETANCMPKGLIVDSHISHLLPKRLVDFCVVITSPDLKLLKNKLKRRKYSLQKIRENLQAEIFQVCLGEARDIGHKIIIFNDGSKEMLLKKLKKLL